jgi:hypothetical protein
MMKVCAPRCLALSMGMMMLASAAPYAQTLVQWRIENKVRAQQIMPYQGQPSPFPAPKTPVEMAPVEGEEGDSGLRRQALMDSLKGMMTPQRAFQQDVTNLNARGLTTGVNGPRVLLGRDWLGEGEDVRLSFSVSGDIRSAIGELQSLDADEAQRLAGKVNAMLGSMQKQASKVDKIDVEGRKVWIKTPLGSLEIPVRVNP